MNTYGVVGLEPIADEEGVVGGGRGERDGDEGAAEDADAAEAARGLVEREGREVVVRADLVLHLQHVSEVPPRRDRARRPVHAVLERVPPLLYPVPAKMRRRSRIFCQKSNKYVVHDEVCIISEIYLCLRTQIGGLRSIDPPHKKDQTAYIE